MSADVPNNAKGSLPTAIEHDVVFSPSSLTFHVELPAEGTISEKPLTFHSPVAAPERVSRTGSQVAPAVRLKSRSFTPKSGVYAEQFTATAADEGQRKHALLQLSEPLTPETRTELEREGVLLLDYVPNQAYFASVPAALTVGSQRLPEVIHWLGPMEPADRVAREVRDSEVGDWAIGNDGRWLLEITLFDDVPLSTAIAALEQAGVDVLEASSALNSATVASPIDAIDALSAIDAVQWIAQIPPPRESLNENARRVTGAEVLRAVPYDLDGSGVAVAIWEVDKVSPHPDFADRLIYGENDRSFSTHPTHVTGTVGGDGGDQYRGIAPGATLLAYDILNSSGGGDNFPTLLNEYGTAIGIHDVVSSNNSWGSVVSGSNCSAFGNYNSSSAFFDGIVEGDAGEQITVVFAAGNSRNDNICGFRQDQLYENYASILPGGQAAKNTITVGATVSYAAPNEDNMTTFSSWGPTDDGRVKPEIVAPGSVLFSTTGNPTSGFSYGGLQGTSMASPTVAGGVALLTERLRQWDLPDRRPDLIKALLVQSARDGLPGANHPDRVGPDYIYGYGRMDLVRAIGLIDGGNIDLGSASAGLSEHNRTVYVPEGATTLKATLAWIDPPAASNALTALVNDLDLEIWGPPGSPCQPCYPWTLDPANPSFDAVRDKANHVDNLEQVVVDESNLVAGHYTVRVNPSASGSQEFALVWSVEISKETQIVNNGAAAAILAVGAENGSSWLSAGGPPWAVAAANSEMLTVSVDPTGLGPGTYQDNLRVTLVDPFGVIGRVSLPVTFEVLPLGSIQGTLTLEGRAAHGGVNVSLSKAGSLVGVTLTDATGAFLFQDVPAGSYTAAATAPGFLKVEAAVEVTVGVDTAGLSLLLLAGDVDSDDQVGLLDLIYIVERLGTATTLADLNRDGIVDVRDMVLVARNFGVAL